MQKQELAPLKNPLTFNENNLKKILWVVFGLYALLAFYGVINHEPWRDEAEAWLIARDTSFAGILKMLPSEGHPPLWYLFIFPFVKLGLSYYMFNYTALVIMTATVYLLLFKSDLPVLLKCLLPFSYFLLYEYTFFARNYCLVVFFIAAIISGYKTRFDRPVLFALAIVGLFNSHILVFSFACSLTGFYIMDAICLKKISDKRVVFAIALQLVGGLYLVPYMGSSKMASSYAADIPAVSVAAVQNIQHGLLVDGNIGLAVILFIFLIVGLIQQPRLLLLLIGGLAGVFYILWFVYLGSVRHEGMIFIILLTVYALRPYYEMQWLSRSKPLSHSYVILIVVILLQLKPAIGNYFNDVEMEYSGSRSAAEFLKEFGLNNKIIVGAQAWAVQALLPYLPEAKAVYYPECDRMGTYYKFDTCYAKKTWLLAPDFAVDAGYRKYHDRIQDIILIVNHPFYYKNEAYLDKLFVNEPVLRGDETFYIYKFKENVR